ncbi:uncharacterized protein [Antedon mediterranea]|uniref:uncharacterized protein n=1 Tax=Antedon mediterranea TaxID=105859 RepID=UPI003AF9CF2A
MKMFYFICLLFFTLRMSITKGEDNECSYFQYKSSVYKVNRFTNSSSTETWHDLKDICKASGGYLMCITTSDELQFVVDRLNKSSCSGYRFGIGLSRQAGLRRDVDANWKCEGDSTTLDTKITPWANENPSRSDGDDAGIRIMSDTGYLRDIKVIGPFSDRNDGYICEYDLVGLFVTSLPGDVTAGVKMSPIRCALQCFRKNDCQRFHVDTAAGCQLRTNEINDYKKISYRM